MDIIYKNMRVLASILFLASLVPLYADDGFLAFTKHPEPLWNPKFSVRGTVVSPTSETHRRIYIENNGVCYSLEDGRHGICRPLLKGDIVILSGNLWRGPSEGRVGATCTKVSVVGHSQLEDPPLVSAAEFQKGSHLRHRVKVCGTLKDCFTDSIDDNCIFLFLATADGDICLIAPRDTIATFRPFIGKTIEVVGVCSREDAGQRKYLQRVLTIPGTDGLSELTDVRHSVPKANDLHALTNATPEKIATAGPREAVGQVLAIWHNDTFLLKTDLGHLVTVTLAASRPPEVGTRVEVCGLPETDLFYLKLARADWVKAGGAPGPEENPAPLRFRDVLTGRNGAFAIDSNCHGRTVRSRAVVRGLITDESGNPRLLLEQDGLTLLLDCSACGNAIADIPPGSLIEATGVCALESESWTPNNALPKVKGLMLVPRSANDIRILSRPPWWTPVRLWSAIGILIASLIAIFIWNRQLQSRVERRSRALVKAERLSLKSALRIDERTRLAAELHDSVAQSMTVISYQLSAAETALAAGNANTKDYLAVASNTLQSCRTELRRCIWDLRSNVLDENDFEKALLLSSSPVAGSSKLHVRFKVRRSKICDSCAHAVLSIVRELVSNAARHGKASLIRVAGDFRDGLLRFSVQDDGIGFDPAHRLGQENGHFGLDGVSERVRRAGGTISIESTTGNGTRIVIGLPAVSAEAARDLK